MSVYVIYFLFVIFFFLGGDYYIISVPEYLQYFKYEIHMQM